MKLELSRRTLGKYRNILFHEDPSIGKRVVPCGRTDMTKLTVAFRNFAKAPKNCFFGLRAYLTQNSCLNPVAIVIRTLLIQEFAQELYQSSATAKNNMWLVGTVEL